MRLAIALLLLPSLAHAGATAGPSAEASPEALDVLFAVRGAKPKARRILRSVIERQRSKLLACYRRARPKVGDGVWMAAVTARRKRHMLVRDVRSTLGHLKMRACVGGVLGALILDRFATARVTFAFVRLPQSKVLGRPSGLQAPLIVGGGSLTKGEISRTIQAHRGQVKTCYEKALQRHPRLAGKIVVKFAIGPSGHVASAKVRTSTIKDAQLARCIERAIVRWVFPQPRGGAKVLVSYPFILRPSP